MTMPAAGNSVRRSRHAAIQIHAGIDEDACRRPGRVPGSGGVPGGRFAAAFERVVFAVWSPESESVSRAAFAERFSSV
jgi:hypothetical protein